VRIPIVVHPVELVGSVASVSDGQITQGSGQTMRTLLILWNPYIFSCLTKLEN
jgi:hypothetical protein